ncbi:MAG: hypothetical protein AB1405_07940 [Bdellovibrionota bacterium]
MTQAPQISAQKMIAMSITPAVQWLDSLGQIWTLPQKNDDHLDHLQVSAGFTGSTAQPEAGDQDDHLDRLPGKGGQKKFGHLGHLHRLGCFK